MLGRSAVAVLSDSRYRRGMPGGQHSVGDIRVAVTDMYPNFAPASHPLVGLMSKALAIDPAAIGTAPADVRRADLVVYSVFGRNHLLSGGTNVAMSAEPTIRDAAAHWTMDWRHRPTGNHLRIPVWGFEHLGKSDLLGSMPDPAADDASQRRFCNFIYSNPNCGMRNAFFSMLHDREHVDALGQVHRNASDPRLGPRNERTWGSTKLEVLRDYRFTIAFENEEHPGYTTEKLVHAWAAGSVPVYWGDPLVDFDFPPGSYLSLYEAGTATRLVEQVLEAHHDPVRYEQLRAANPFRTGHLANLAQHLTESTNRFVGEVAQDALAHRGSARIGAVRRGVRLARYARSTARARLIALAGRR